MVAREIGPGRDSRTSSKMTSKGRGKGIERLKELAKMTVRPPKAMLEELGIPKKEDPPRTEVIDSSLQALSINDDETPQSLQSPPTKIDDQVPETLPSSPSITDDNANNDLDSSAIVNDEKIDAKIEDSNSKSEIADQKLSDQEQNTANNIIKQGQHFDERLVRNVDCVEFTPTKRTLNTSAPEFIPLDDENDSFDEDDGEQSTTSASEEANTSTDRPALLRVPSQGEDGFLLDLFKDTIHTVTNSPGEFDTVIDNLVETITGFMTQNETMKEMVNILLEQAISEQNFLYSAVRMIEVFIEKLDINDDIKFRNCFYKQLRELHSEIVPLLADKKNHANIARVSGISILFADLLCHVKLGNDLNKAFLKAVFKIIELLQIEPNEKMVEILIKVLKLSGPTLDEYKRKGDDGIPEVDQMFNYLRDLYVGKEWLKDLDNGDDLREKVFKVYKLHTRDWDRSQFVASETPLPFKKARAPKTPKSRTSSISDVSEGIPDWNEYCGADDFDQEEEYDDEYEKFLRESGQL